MREYKGLFSLTKMAAVLDVSRSGYYAWTRVGYIPGPRALAPQERDRKVKEAFDKSKQRDGARRIQVELAMHGDRHDVKTIADSNHKLSVAPNLLAQDFTASGPNQKWAGDITYLLTSEGWLYLAVIIDLYSRAVIGWSMNTRMTADLVCDALQMALWRRGFPRDVIVHSDRGSQYCSHAYRDLIDEQGLRQSMSRKGNCWDNACVESFFHSLRWKRFNTSP